ncbi:MAG: PEP-CTERM sorting domain-containing protein [Phycisphaerae bacterium]
MRAALITLAVLALAVPAMAVDVIFADDFSGYASGTILNPDGAFVGDGPGGWGSKDTGKANPGPFTADGAGVVSQTGMLGAQRDTTHAFNQLVTDGQVYFHMNVKVDTPSGGYCGRFMRKDTGALIEWSNNMLKVVDGGYGNIEWIIEGRGISGNAASVGLAPVGAWHDLLLEVDFDSGTYNAWMNKTLADVGSLGVADASVTATHLVDGMAGFAFIEWGNAPTWSLSDVNAGYVPEPATMALLGLGGLGVLIRKRR